MSTNHVDLVPRHPNGSLQRAVEILLDLGLSDEAIAAYLLRFNSLRIETLVCEHSRSFWR